MTEKYRICISSPPDREKLVAEIFFGNIQWAELNQEGEILQMEFYSRPDGQPWQISFQDARLIMYKAKQKPIGD